MKTIFAIGFLGFCLVVAGVTHVSAAQSSFRVGFVDLQRTLAETKTGKKARNKLETEKKRRQGEIDKKQKALEAKAKQLEKKRVVMKPDVLQKKQEEIQKEYVALQQTFMQLQQELTVSEQKASAEILKQATTILQDIAKKRGFTMLLEKNESAVLYADKSLDVTAELNKRIDK